MAKRKKTRRVKRSAPKRRKRGTIGKIMKKRSAPRASGGMMATTMEAATIAGGLVAGQYLGKILAEKVPQLADGKIRGAAMIAVGVLGAKYVPKGFRGIALGVAASGAYQLAKEVLPAGTISGDIGALNPGDVELIEAMALESEVNGLEDDMEDTMTGMDQDVVNTVTGADYYEDEDGY